MVFLEKNTNTQRKLLDVDLGDHFTDMTQTAPAPKAKTDKRDYVRLQRTCPAQETIRRVESQLLGREKVFADHISNRCVMLPQYMRNSYNSTAEN